MASCHIKEWIDAPQMSTGAPMPGIVFLSGSLYLAYIVSDAEPTPGATETFAIVRFDGVLQHTFGYPNDKALGGHPLYSAGLKFYAFNEIIGSPYLRELGERNAKMFPGTSERYTQKRHWIISFHDETLEVVADSITYMGREACVSALEAISRHAT